MSTERIFISCTPALVIASTSGSVSRVLRLTTTLPVAGSLTSSAVVRPRMRIASGATTVPASMMARTLMPSLVPQSWTRDDAVLRHVDQTARQVARVRGLQGGVGQTLTGAVGRVEVLEHRQAFLEVRDDRRLDDLTRRLGHQAAHAGELTHLRRRTARAGMRHHVDRVDLHVAPVGVLLGGRDFLHHRVGDGVGGLRPGVDDLVVLLALGDEAVVVLLLELLGEFARGLDGLPLRRRHHHVVLAERDAGLERVIEAERHDAVAEDDRLFLAAVAVDLIDHPGDFALRHQLVDDVERRLDVTRQHVAEHHAAGRGVVPLVVRPCPSRRRRSSDT